MSPVLTIRFAMLLGVLLFGGVVYFTRQAGSAPEVTPEQAGQLVWIGRALWAVAVIGSIACFQAFQRTPARTALATWSIIAWALGEMTALFGAVVWFLTGTPAWYVPGLLFLVITFLVFPARRE